MLCEEVRNLKEIGNGVIGIVYKAEIDKKEVIIKRSHIKEKDIISTLDLLTEFDTFARLYPDHFMVYESYRIKKNCEFNHVIPIELKNTKNKKDLKWYADIHNSNMCFDIIYSPKLDGTLGQFIDNTDFINDKKLTHIMPAILIQLLYIENLMRMNGWIHLDMHTSNIMYKKTKDSSIAIKINNTKYDIPTFGKLWYIVDYDPYSLFHLNNESYNKKLKHLYIIKLLTYMIPIWRYGNYKPRSHSHLVNYLYKSEKFDDIKKHIPIDIIINEPETTSICAEYICFILYPDLYCKIQGIPDKEIEKHIKVIHTKQPIKLDTLLYCIENLIDRKKIINKLMLLM